MEQYLTVVLGALAGLGSGILSILLIPQKRKEASLKNEDIIIQRWGNIVAALEAENASLRQENTGLREELKNKRILCSQYMIENSELKVLKCLKVGCVERKPSIGDFIDAQKN